jgi:hypothetical protein
MAESDGTDDADGEATSGPEPDPDGTGVGTVQTDGLSFVPSRPVAAVVVALLVQAALAAYLLTVDAPSTTQMVARGIWGLAFLSLVLIGYDAYATDRSKAVDWGPNPFLWAIPMLFPLVGPLPAGISFGVGLAYALRRYQTLRRGLDHVWHWVAVGGGVFSGAGLAVFITSWDGALPVESNLAALVVVTAVFYGLTTPATYYDTLYVRRRLADSDTGWFLRGYHWVVAMSIPHPLRSIVALGYALRRWMLLSSTPLIGTDPDAEAAGDDDKE